MIVFYCPYSIHLNLIRKQNVLIYILCFTGTSLLLLLLSFTIRIEIIYSATRSPNEIKIKLEVLIQDHS